MTNYKWELKQKETSVFSNDIKELQRLQVNLVDLYKGDCLEREDGVTYIATISGGKDSTCMCDLLLENKFPVDYILFYDTLLEHKEMYDYIDKVDSYFYRKYKKRITILKPRKKDFVKDYMFKERVKGDFKGYLHGFLSPNVGFCHWRTHSKIDTEQQFIKNKKIKKCKKYIGFTTDEAKRTNREDNSFLYPLVDIFKMSDLDCRKYLIEQEMENPLYRHFSRTGCSICPFQSEKHWYEIYKNYKDVWQWMKNQELELSKHSKVVNPLAFGKVSIFDKEKEFKTRQKGLFDDFPDEPLKDCFCKI